MVEAYRNAAEALRKAYRGGPIPPLREYLDPQDSFGAYQIQAINTALWKEQGRRVVGRKIGLTARAVQAQLGVKQPDYGVLFEDMHVPDHGVLTAPLLQPKAEAEIAFILARDLAGPTFEAEEVAAAVQGVCAAIEIVDSRIEGWKITFADTVADNGSSAFFCLGEERKPLEDLDLRTCGMILEVNDDVTSLGTGAACLGNPLNAATWLASTLARLGDPLRAGDIILTGALGPMVEIKPGDALKAVIGGVGSAEFSYEPSSD